LAFGLPIVATDVGTIRSTLGVDNVVLVAAQDPQAAAHAAAALWSNPQDRQSRIDRGRAVFDRMLSDTPTVGQAARNLVDLTS